MLDIKNWLEVGTGLKVADTAFITKVNLPFITFLEDKIMVGSDLENDIVDANITIELYTAKVRKDLEKKIENLMDVKAFKYSKSRMWVESEKCFETTYDFNFLERNE